jgi:ATP-dependent DNA helicase RecQ
VRCCIRAWSTRLNADSRAVLRGERRVDVAESAPRVVPGRKSRRSEAAAAVTPADEGLFQTLRDLRKRLATEAGVPPYVVFTDASLRAMAELRPTTLDAFARIPGVGDRKLAQYGETFTIAILEHGA